VRQPMSTRERVLLTLTVCFAIMLVPTTALAALQIVNIADPANASRVAKVTDVGALQVQTRPGIPVNTINRTVTGTTSGWRPLFQLSSGRNLAVVEMTFGNAGSARQVNIAYYNIPSTGTCANPTASTGEALGTLRRLIAPGEATLQVDFSGVPLSVPAAATGRTHCFGVMMGSGGSGAILEIGVAGYTYVP